MEIPLEAKNVIERLMGPPEKPLAEMTNRELEIAISSAISIALTHAVEELVARLQPVIDVLPHIDADAYVQAKSTVDE